uniref:Uncharacterized protein n=1 Tax=Neospora caninum (strain Liverpool) TaxID=572307 RepID=A0A0F7UI34_NEOCL|nr:TPA: hypothetical protein BN1204_053230 [Neospora caninum Liverpool]
MSGAAEMHASGDPPEEGGETSSTATASVDSALEPRAADKTGSSNQKNSPSEASAPHADSDANGSARKDGPTPTSSSPAQSDRTDKKARSDSPRARDTGPAEPSSAPADRSSDAPEPDTAATAAPSAGGEDSTFWSYFRWGDPWASTTPGAGETPPGPDAADGGDSQKKSKGGSTVVRFQGVTSDEDNAATKPTRPRKENSVDKMGFVDLVESLLLNHDTTGRTGRFIDSFSTSEFASERDSDLDSMVSTELKGSAPDDSLVWQMEDIMVFEDQLHAALSTKLEQHARHMESSLRKGLVELEAQLGDDDEIKMIHYEARMAGLDLIPGVDTPNDASVRRIDLSTLMNLSSSNYEESMSKYKQRASSELLMLPSETALPFSPRRQGPAVRGSPGSWGAESGRSPLHQIQAELLRLGSTSSEESTSEDDSTEKRKAAKNSAHCANGDGRSPAQSTSSSAASTKDKRRDAESRG